jgi:hypothetical protein
MFLNQPSFAGKLSIVFWYFDRITTFFLPSYYKIMASYRGDKRPVKDSIGKLALLSTFVRRKKLPLDWVLMKMKNQDSLIKVLGRVLLLDLPEG